MKITIKAKEGYKVVECRNIFTGETAYRVDDGCQPLFIARMKDYDEFIFNQKENEMFSLCEVFTTIKGNRFVYWRDDELDKDYITKV